MRRFPRASIFVLSAAILVSPAIAADRTVLGKKLLVRDPDGTEPRRVTVVLARERNTDVPAIVGDPTADGAILRVTTGGANPTDAFYGLNAADWRATPTGFVFRAGQSETDPVLRAILKRSSGGVALMKVVLRGNVGTRDLDVVPPNPSTMASVVLSVSNGGDRYCASYGGAAGGTVVRDDDTQLKIREATAEPPCPADPPQLCCSFSNQPSCGWAGDAEECVFFGGTPGDGDSVCDSATGLCGAPPGNGGLCCQGPTTVFGSTCAAGPAVTFCTGLGGTLFSNAACTPAGTCVSPSGAFVDPPRTF